MKINWFTAISGIILSLGGILQMVANAGPTTEVEAIMTAGGLILIAIGMKE